MVEVKDTFSECFEMWFSRILITAFDEELALDAARSAVGFATSIIMCSAEAGIEKFLPSEQTPDGRPGVIIQIWTRRSKKMKDELLARISQCVMTAPTTSVFNILKDGTKSEPIGKLISYFGDGYQKKIKKFNRDMWEIPVMDGSFFIEESFNFAKGLAGGILLVIGTTKEDTLTAARAAVRVIHESPAIAITSFPSGICRSGSKIGSKYSFLDESTNHQFCPSLQGIVDDSLLPKGSICVYEIVINAINEEELRKAMHEALASLKKHEQLLQVTSSNFNGELGNVRINLKDLI